MESVAFHVRKSCIREYTVAWQAVSAMALELDFVCACKCVYINVCVHEIILNRQ